MLNFASVIIIAAFCVIDAFVEKARPHRFSVGRLCSRSLLLNTFLLQVCFLSQMQLTCPHFHDDKGAQSHVLNKASKQRFCFIIQLLDESLQLYIKHKHTPISPSLDTYIHPFLCTYTYLSTQESKQTEENV